MISCTFKETFFVFFLGLTQLCDAPRRAAKQPYKYGCLDTDERMLRSAYQNAVEETQHLEAGNLMGGKHDVGLSRLGSFPLVPRVPIQNYGGWVQNCDVLESRVVV